MKEITVCLLEGIGNTVMATPMIEALKKLGYKVKFLINPRGKNLVHMIGKHEYKIGNNTKEPAAIPTLWARCGPRIISPEKTIAKRLDPLIYHESEINMTIARSLGYTGKTPAPVIYGTKPTKNDTIIIATGCKPGAIWAKKKYPHWEKLCEELSKKYKLSFLGTTGESEPWMDKLGDNKCDKIGLKDSINWIAGSNGMIAIDNGLAHISAALNLPTNVIFGPTLLSKNKPLGQKVNIILKDSDCSPCQLTNKWNKCGTHTCMSIPVDTILDKLQL
jgi:ADP-heptose:LPS heptosyltransferase